MFSGARLLLTSHSPSSLFQDLGSANHLEDDKKSVATCVLLQPTPCLASLVH